MTSLQSRAKRQRLTPPDSRSGTPSSEPTDGAAYGYATPGSQSSAIADLMIGTPKIPANLTQAMVEADPKLHRFQQDLLLLTSFNETETLHWRPSWFKQDPHSKSFWTLYNPPNVVTELLPRSYRGRLVYTRRMRRDGDRPPNYIKDWDHWERYCELRGIPSDFLCEVQIGLMRLGLLKDANNVLRAPPNYPLYPEYQPLGTGRYLLSTSVYQSHLPSTFHGLRTTGADEEIQVVVVHSNGALKIEQRENFFQHASQWTHNDGRGGYTDDRDIIGDFSAPKDQAMGRRWNWVPWTGEQEGSCKDWKDGDGQEIRYEEGILKIKLRLWKAAEKKSENKKAEAEASKANAAKKRKW